MEIREGLSKEKVFKEKYGSKLEFPEGWGQGGGGGANKKTCGVMDIFWNHTMAFLLPVENNHFTDSKATLTEPFPT